MTDTHDLIGAIRRDLHAVSDHYDDALEPPRRPSVKLPTETAPGTPMRYAVRAMKEAPPPVSLHVLDARREAHTDLHFWARFVMGEVRDINGDHIRVRIDATDVPALARFVAHWADRIATDHPDEAADLAAEASKHARTLRALALPDRRDWLPIGACPVTVDAETCGATVRAYADRHTIKCDRCGTEGNIDWWMAQLTPDTTDHTHAATVIACVAARSHIILSHGQIRQWAYLGHIQRRGKDSKGRTLYSTAAVLAYAQHQTKENAPSELGRHARV